MAERVIAKLNVIINYFDSKVDYIRGVVLSSLDGLKIVSHTKCLPNNQLHCDSIMEQDVKVGFAIIEIENAIEKTQAVMRV